MSADALTPMPPSMSLTSANRLGIDCLVAMSAWR
jgi:hypothetical protein